MGWRRGSGEQSFLRKAVRGHGLAGWPNGGSGSAGEGRKITYLWVLRRVLILFNFAPPKRVSDNNSYNF